MSNESGRRLLQALLHTHSQTATAYDSDVAKQALAVIASDADEQRAEIVAMLLADAAWWRRDGRENIANVLSVAAEKVRAGRELASRGEAER